jgi:hypothetical protein
MITEKVEPPQTELARSHSQELLDDDLTVQMSILASSGSLKSFTMKRITPSQMI